MEDNVYRTMKNAIWGTAVAVSIGISAYSGFNYLSTKSNNEHYAERVQADIQKAETMQKLLQSPEYQSHLQQRRELTEKLLEDKRIRSVDVIEGIVDQALGDFDFKEK